MLTTGDGRGRASSRAQCGAALLVVLAHLVLMALPLHAMGTDLGSSPGAMAGAGSQTDMPSLLPPGGSNATCAESCMLGWSPPAARFSIHLMSGPVLIDALRPPVGELVSGYLLTRALDPPVAGDSQALLQVFRI